MNTPNLPLKVTVDVNKLIDQIQPIFKNDLTKMISDYFSTKRMENLVKILSKASERMKTFGVSSADLDNISTKFKINWYTLASQEDDDSIQEFWAKLLVQECLENSSVSLRTLDLLHKLTSTEAIILDNYFSEILFYDDNGRGDEKYIFPQVVSLFGQDDEYYPDISRFN